MKEEIQNCLKVLNNGGLILYPTDTVWGIGCDATQPAAIEKIRKLKQRSDEKSMICLVSNFKMLQEYVEDVPEMAYDILKTAQRPTTIVYDNPIRVAENLIAEDNTLGIRVCRNKFCNMLIKKFRRPIVSTSANISGKPTPKRFDEIDDAILKGTDYAVNLDRKEKTAKPSSIIKLSNDGQIKIIRK
jgi:L-threonylcarbamoyladenylate synthase